MKIKSILMTAAIALVGVASASASMTYTQGDLILGIYNSANPSLGTYEFNLGSYASFANRTVGQGYLTISTGTDLSNIFGSDWATNPSIKWGFAALVSDATTKQIALGIPEATLNTKNATLFTKFTLTSAVNNTRNQVSPYGLAYANGTTYSGNNGALFANSVVGEISDYDTSSDFATGKQLIATLGNATTGVSNSALDLFFYNGTAAGVYEGTFAIDSNGTIGFSPDVALLALPVPEPSTYVMIAGGLAAMTLLRRRSLVNA